MIIGIDEVGRGAWAGPLLVVSATGEPPVGVADSKALTRTRRETILHELLKCCSFGEGWVSAREIDKVGLAAAMRIGVARSLCEIGALHTDRIIMDGSVNYCHVNFQNVETVIKADSLHPIVSAASIYAKVKRDLYMAQLDTIVPGYGFSTHVGYGTQKHRQALKAHGVSEQHRLSYRPVKELL